MDWSVIIVGVLALTGTLVGSYMSNNKNKALVVYRLQQLEEKVDKHNKVIERTYKIEEHEEIIDERIKVINHRIDDLEELHK